MKNSIIATLLPFVWLVCVGYHVSAMEHNISGLLYKDFFPGSQRVSSSVTFDSEATVSRFTSEWFNQNKHIIDVMRTETMTVNLASLPMNKCENTPLIQNNFAGTQAWYLKTGSRGSEIVTFRVPTVIVTRMYFQLLSNTTTGSLFCFVLNNNQVSVRFPVQDHSTNTQNIQQSSLHNDSISNVCCTLRSTYVAVVSIVLLLFVVQSN